MSHTSHALAKGQHQERYGVCLQNTETLKFHKGEVQRASVINTVEFEMQYGSLGCGMLEQKEGISENWWNLGEVQSSVPGNEPVLISQL